MGDMDQVREQRLKAQLDTIEARLAEHPAVAGAAAAVRDDRLVAYVVCASGATPDERALREHLQATLPHYMIPRQFVDLSVLPREPGGGVDRHALPDPNNAPSGARAVAVAPRIDSDARTDYLAGLWSRLLGKEVGPQDNFFDLGGHSMLAVQMANQVKLDTGVRIQLMTLATQTLAQIASELPVGGRRASEAGLGARLVGNLKGMLWSGKAARQS